MSAEAGKRDHYRNSGESGFDYDRNELMFWDGSHDDKPTGKCLTCNGPADFEDDKAWGSEWTGPYGSVEVFCDVCETYYYEWQ